MKSKFRQIALIGKYAKEVKESKTAKNLDSVNPSKLRQTASTSQILQSLTHFLHLNGADVVIEKETAESCDLSNPQVQNITQIGKSCDLAIVVGGDGTMLGFGRQLAPYNVPLIGINQGRLGFITDIALDQIETTLEPMLKGNYTEDLRSLFLGKVMRDDACVFSTLAMNDVVVKRGATSGMVELRVEVNGHFLSNQTTRVLVIVSLRLTENGATTLKPVSD